MRADRFECACRYSNTTATVVTSRRSVEWMGQLINVQETGMAWALHGDGKHKLHHGRWVLMTFGTHCLRWDAAIKDYRHTFCPLVYMFSKQIESTESVKMAMHAAQIVAMHFYKKRLVPAVNISDHSDGLRSGMQFINIDVMHTHMYPFACIHAHTRA